MGDGKGQQSQTEGLRRDYLFQSVDGRRRYMMEPMPCSNASSAILMTPPFSAPVLTMIERRAPTSRPIPQPIRGSSRFRKLLVPSPRSCLQGDFLIRHSREVGSRYQRPWDIIVGQSHGASNLYIDRHAPNRNRRAPTIQSLQLATAFSCSSRNSRAANCANIFLSAAGRNGATTRLKTSWLSDVS